MPHDPGGKDYRQSARAACVRDGRTTIMTSRRVFVAQTLAWLGAAAASVGCSASGAAVRQAEFVGAELPTARVDLGTLSSSAPVSNAEAVVLTQIQPGAKRCY